MTITCN